MLVPLSGESTSTKELASLSRQEIAIPMDTVMTIQVLKIPDYGVVRSPSTLERVIPVTS